LTLLSAAERFAAMDRSTVVLDARRCLHSQDQYSTCVACEGVCPVDAIQPGKPPILQTEACQSCMVCLTACPVGAFQSDDAIAPLLNCVPRMEASCLELVCEKHTHAEIGTADYGAIRIKGCLAGIGAGGYLMLAALDVEKIIVRTDACAACEWRGLRGRVEGQVSQARQLLGMWGKAESLLCVAEVVNPVERPLWAADNPPLSRRDLFRMLAKQGQIAMARAMENKIANAEKQAGRDRRRLLFALEHLPATHSIMAMSLKNFDFANISISEKCNACGACANACPTQALCFEKTTDDSSFTLTFSARACIGCDVCTHVCAPAAVSLDHSPLLDQVFGMEETVVVRAGDLAQCARCRTRMAKREGTDLCTLCEYRNANPFGSILPQGMKVPENLAKRKSNS
jgi:ferredoxin